MYYLLYLSKSLSIFLLRYAAPTKCLKPPQSDRGAHTQGLVAPPLGFKDSKNLSLKKKNNNNNESFQCYTSHNISSRSEIYPT